MFATCRPLQCGVGERGDARLKGNKAKMRNRKDIQVENHGTTFLFWPQSKAGQAWLRENTDGTWYGNALVVESRYAFDLAQGALDSGLRVG